MEGNGTGKDGHSLASYARHRGCSTQSVSRAVKASRLSKSVTRSAAGQPRITSFELADEEWRNNTNLSTAPIYVREREAARTKPAFPSARALRPDGAGDITGVDDSTLVDDELESLSVVVVSGQRDHVIVFGGAVGAEEVRLVMSKETAGSLALKLWTSVAGTIEDLQSVTRAALARN